MEITVTKRRTYTEPRVQLLYDELRAQRPDPAKVRGAGGIGNAYAVGYTQPDAAAQFFPHGSRSYAVWAAGVDNAPDDRKASRPLRPATTPNKQENAQVRPSPAIELGRGRRGMPYRRPPHLTTDMKDEE